MASQGIRSIILGLDPVPFWFLFTAMVAGARFLLYKGTQAFWRLRTMTDTPTARIQSAAQGYVELSGLARPHLGQVAGPLTGQPCLWYRYRVEKQGGEGSKGWKTVDNGQSTKPLLLDDGTGQCILDPGGADISPRRVERWSGYARDPRITTPSKWYQTKRYRYVEERIEDGEPLYCLGRFETPLRGPAERERLSRALLKIWKQDPARLARFDTDGDGTIGMQEWEQARREAGALAERAEGERRLIPVLAHLTATGDERQPFVISTYAAEELAATLRWHTLWFNLAFVVVAVAAAASALARFGAR
ncbi:GIDE domain-containing protein [uncultured Thiodictyon sp.]|uniref:GIDE domain-containing protein n=1 Tax=uncultured Thiodictyon sp. TaxID=1846217 RepID=UPI0025D2CD84|nr:GIDE domain-containing protein [uncultured Thiodictyon sp.]